MLLRQSSQSISTDERQEPLQVLGSLKTLSTLEPLEIPLAMGNRPAFFDVSKCKDVEELLFLCRGGVEQGQCRADELGGVERDQQLAQHLPLGRRGFSAIKPAQ